MKVTIDSGEPLERVLPVINALYGVSLSLPETTIPASAPRVSRRSRTAKAGREAARRASQQEGHGQCRSSTRMGPHQRL